MQCRGRDKKLSQAKLCTVTMYSFSQLEAAGEKVFFCAYAVLTLSFNSLVLLQFTHIHTTENSRDFIEAFQVLARVFSRKSPVQ